MAEFNDSTAATASPLPTPSLEDIQHWTFVMGRAQQMMMAHLGSRDHPETA